MSDELRCPECGNESDIEQHDHPHRPTRARCGECDELDVALAFHSAYKRHRMSDEELREMKRQEEIRACQQAGQPGRML
jgi:hypothetical protein